MNRYLLEVIKEGDTKFTIEADGYQMIDGCYQFFDQYDSIIKIVGSYPIHRTIIYRIDYNVSSNVE
jgi:hypothetical protein